MASIEAVHPPLHQNEHDIEEEDQDLDADAILAELEQEDEASSLAILRKQHLQAQNSTKSQSTSTSISGPGSKLPPPYQTLQSDDSTLNFTTSHEKAIVHFFHPDFSRCSIMDDHLSHIARKHQDYSASDSETKFARVDVSHATFVVEKLGIRVLPCVIGFVGGVVKGRIVGFEGVCWDGNEKGERTRRGVEDILVEMGILRKGVGGDEDEDRSGSEDEREDEGRKNGRRGIQGRKQVIEDDGDDWD